LIRILLFFDIHEEVVLIDKTHVDKGLGSFFAEYIDDRTGSILVSVFLLFLFVSYYLSNFWMIKQMNKMSDFVAEKNKDLQLDNSGSGSNSEQNSRRNSMDVLESNN
jgi:hypothetical protein